jgi:hypothetical protein
MSRITGSLPRLLLLLSLLTVAAGLCAGWAWDGLALL